MGSAEAAPPGTRLSPRDPTTPHCSDGGSTDGVSDESGTDRVGSVVPVGRPPRAVQLPSAVVSDGVGINIHFLPGVGRHSGYTAPT